MKWKQRLRQVKRLLQDGLWSAPALAADSGVRRASVGPAAALAWVKAQELASGGLRVHSGHTSAYAEVTGYMIPTLLDYGEPGVAARFADWLLCVQRASGGYADPDEGRLHVFDTAQVLRGLLAAARTRPGAAEAARRTADFLCAEMVDGGRGGFGNRYHGTVPESVHLFALPPLRQAAVHFGNEAYARCVDLALAHYLALPDCLQVEQLTHFLGYQLDALLDLGRPDLVQPVLNRLGLEQDAQGAVRGRGGVEWVCTTGLAQLAICWYRAGAWQRADAAMAWLDTNQHAGGGFVGSLGPEANYFPEVRISWAAKFYLDAHRLRVGSFMERHHAVFPDHVADDDGRVEALMSFVREGDRVAEVGCGKGRFLQALKRLRAGVACTGYDVAPGLLASVPPGIETHVGSLETTGAATDSFDVTFSVEAIEHCANPPAAIRELARITRPGGWVLVIDKHAGAWGRLECPPWETWLESPAVKSMLGNYCDHVAVRDLGYDGHGPDGLMVAWIGRKRCRLSPQEWTGAIVADASGDSVVQRVKTGTLSPWGRTVIGLTRPGDRVLEIGSGTGEISLAMALAGRAVTLLDYGSDVLEGAAACAARLGVAVSCIRADGMAALPFADRAFDCVWSSGLLEHFSSAERVAMLRESARVSRGIVLALVPNAACIAYRIGKLRQEQDGHWAYGFEAPLTSLRDDFEAAGLEAVTESTVGATHALSFLPPAHPLRLSMAGYAAELGDESLSAWGQGYLLVTVGRVKREAHGVA